jgi:DNA-directed RNA polymerase subunit RPC12/RpoP
MGNCGRKINSLFKKTNDIQCPYCNNVILDDEVKINIIQRRIY